MPDTRVRVIIEGDSSGARRATQEAGQATRQFASNAKSDLSGAGASFSNFSVGASAAIGTFAGQVLAQAASAVADFARDAIQDFGDLEQAVANISTIKPEIDNSAVFASLNEMQTRVPQTAKELGESLYDVFSSVQVSQKEGIALVEQFAKGATGAGTDAKTFGTSVMGVMNAYKLTTKDATKISDQFFNTVNAGVVTGQELASSLGPVTQAARAAGQSTEFLFAAIAAVTKEGGPAAQNINNLNNTLQKITTTDAREALTALGVATADASGKFRPMEQILTDLKAKLAPLPEAARAAKLNEIFPDSQARQGAMTLMSQLDTLKTQLQTNATAVGVTDAAYAKMSGTMQSQTKIIQNTFSALGTAIGSEVLPYIMPMITTLGKELPDTVKGVKASFAQFKAGAEEAFRPFKPLIADIVTWFRANFPEIQKAVGTVLRTVAEFWKAHGADVVAVLRPLFAAILNIVKLVAQLINGDWKGAFKTAGDIVRNMVEFVRAWFNNLFKIVGDVGGRVITAVKGLGRDIWQGLVNGLKAGGPQIAQAVGVLMNPIPVIARNILGIRSPSRVMHEIGHFAALGFVNGLGSMNAQIAAQLVGMLKGVEDARAKVRDMIRATERDLLVQKYGEDSAPVLRFDNPALPSKDAINGAAAIASNKELFTRRDNYAKNIKAALDEAAEYEAEQAKLLSDNIFKFTAKAKADEARGAKEFAAAMDGMLTAIPTGPMATPGIVAADGQRSAARETVDALLGEASRTGRQVLETLLGGGKTNRAATLRGLLGDLQNAAVATLTDVLMKSFQPGLRGIVGEIGDVLKSALRGVEAGVFRMLSGVYQLLAITGAQGKKKQSGGIFGALLGGIAAIATGGALLPFLTAGSAIVSFIAEPDLGGGLSVAAALGGGGFGLGGGGGNTMTLEQMRAAQGRDYGPASRSVNVSLYGDINNLGGLDQMTGAITDAVETGLRTGG